MAIAKRIHVLGTGVAIVRKYYNTAFILEDESSYFLVDGMGGIDILRRFDEMKLDWQKLHHAFLSHTHTDHSLGMVYVLRYVAFLMRLNQYDGDFHLYTHKVAYNKIRKVCELILEDVYKRQEYDWLVNETERHMMEKSATCLHKNLVYIREHYPLVAEEFLRKLSRFENDLIEHKEWFAVKKSPGRCV